MNDIQPTPECDADAFVARRVVDGEYHGLYDAITLELGKKLERERDSAKTLNRSLLDQLEAQAEQIEAMRKHDAQRLESDSIVGSCDCLTKTPEVKYHKPGCKYRLISERDEARDWQNVKVTKGGETYCLGTLIQLLEHERDEALALLASEKSTRNAIIKKGVEMERELEAMREAIGVAYESLNVSTAFGTTPKQDQARAKLQPFLKP